MAGVVSLYLQDKTLQLIDAEVERRAAEDRAAGLSGRQVTSRSKLIEQLVEERLGNGNPTLGEIRYAVVSLAKEFGAQKVSLFGSYARGDAAEDSDVDLLLEKGDIKGLRVLDFQSALTEALGRKVDVVTTAGASERLLAKAKRDEVVLYEAG